MNKFNLTFTPLDKETRLYQYFKEWCEFCNSKEKLKTQEWTTLECLPGYSFKNLKVEEILDCNTQSINELNFSLSYDVVELNDKK